MNFNQVVVMRLLYGMMCFFFGIILSYLCYLFITWGDWNIMEWTIRRRFFFLWIAGVFATFLGMVFRRKGAS